MGKTRKKNDKHDKKPEYDKKAITRKAKQAEKSERKALKHKDKSYEYD